MLRSNWEEHVRRRQLSCWVRVHPFIQGKRIALSSLACRPHHSMQAVKVDDLMGIATRHAVRSLLLLIYSDDRSGLKGHLMLQLADQMQMNVKTRRQRWYQSYSTARKQYSHWLNSQTPTPRVQSKRGLTHVMRGGAIGKNSDPTRWKVLWLYCIVCIACVLDAHGLPRTAVLVSTGPASLRRGLRVPWTIRV